MIAVNEERLRELAARFGYNCFGAPSFGWHNKSVGLRATHPNQARTLWVKLFAEEFEAANGREWEGEATAAEFELRSKPALVAIHDYPTNEIVERLIVTDFASAPIAGDSPWQIRNADEVDDNYLADLNETLGSLQQIETDRVNTRYDLVRRRVAEVWGVPVDEEICRWETVHGDLHWANLTLQTLFVLDWEGWGRGLVGQDAANMLAYSGLYPAVAERIRQHFPILQTRQAQLAVMFITAELLRMNELYGDHPELVPSLLKLGTGARNAWQN
tara:strand:+ start:40414 stop:41232 length:819 start_codon:yes stop_codon:yes gene_type:complete